VLFLVLLVIDEYISDDSTMSTIIPGLRLNFKFAVVVLRSPRRRLRFSPLVHGHLSHSTSRIFSTILFEILRTMRIIWIALVRDFSATIKHIVPMPKAVRLINTTEVDVGVAIRIFGNPDIVTILVGNTGALRDGALVVFLAL
jgi:hypothetical protein